MERKKTCTCLRKRNATKFLHTPIAFAYVAGLICMGYIRELAKNLVKSDFKEWEIKAIGILICAFVFLLLCVLMEITYSFIKRQEEQAEEKEIDAKSYQEKA